MCSEAMVKEDVVHTWRPVLLESHDIQINKFHITPQAVLDSLTSYRHKRNIHFVPDRQVSEYLDPCQAVDVFSCNVTGLWEVYDNYTESVCDSGPQLPVLETFLAGKTQVFKNVACIQCNGGRDKRFKYRGCNIAEPDTSTEIARLDINFYTGKCIRRFGGIYAYCRYFIDRKW